MAMGGGVAVGLVLNRVCEPASSSCFPLPLVSLARSGEYERALHYHQCELALSSASGCLLDQGVASRKVGECFCELGEFEEAVKHQKIHLYLSRRLRECWGLWEGVCE